MSFKEKLTWVNAVVTVIVAAVYAWIIGSRAASTPIAEVTYWKPLLIAVGAMIGLTIVGTILMAIGTAIGAEIRGTGSVDEIDREDERDVTISRRGDIASFYVLSALMLGVLALAMLDQHNFWVAQMAFGALLLSGLTSSVAKLVAYRRGF